MQTVDASGKARLADLPAARCALWVRVRWAGLVALLVAELLALSVRYDTASLAAYDGWWPRLVGQSPTVLQFGIAVIMAIVVFSAAHKRDAYENVSDQSCDSHNTWPLFLVGHVIAFALFASLTQRIIEEQVLASSTAGIAVLAWLVMGVCAVGCWGGALLPLRLWRLLLYKLRGVFVVGGVIGAASVASGWLLIDVWPSMGAWTLQFVHAQLNLVSSNAICRPAENIVGTESFSVAIAGPCSGHEGIALICVFLAAYLWLFRTQLKFPQALLLLPIGTIAIWIANSLRITTLILIGTWGWPDIALGGFHSQAGSLAFCAIGLALVAVSSRSRFFSVALPEFQQTAELPVRKRRTNVAAPYLIPFLAVLAATMVTGLFSSGADLFYPLRVIAAVATLWWFRGAYRELRWSWSWVAVALGAIVAVLWIFMIPTRDVTSEASNPSGLTGGWLTMWWLMRLVGYVVTVPIVEELAFRGYLTRRLIDAEFQHIRLGEFTWFSWIGSSVLFGLMHGHYWFLGMGAGMVFAAVLYRRGRLVDAILAHLTTNGLIAAYAAWVGDWSLLS